MITEYVGGPRNSANVLLDAHLTLVQGQIHRFWRLDHILYCVVEGLVILVLHSLQRVDSMLLIYRDVLLIVSRDMHDWLWYLKIDHVDVVQALQPLQESELRSGIIT